MVSFIDYMETPNNNSPVLFHGNMGLAIPLYLSAAISGNEDTLCRAKRHLDAISESIGTLTSPSFGEGLAGIGWAVEVLVQNNLLPDVDTDEILSDIDDFIYKDVTSKKETSPSLYSGGMGKAAYFLKRVRNKNPNSHRYTEIVHLECLSMITEDIDELFRAPNGPLNIHPEEDITRINDGLCQNMKDMADYLHLFSLALLVNKSVIEATIYDIMRLSETLLEALINVDVREGIFLDDRRVFTHSFYLAAAYSYASEIHGHLHWKEKAHRFMEVFTSPRLAGGQDSPENGYRLLATYSIMNSSVYKGDYRKEIEQIIGSLKVASARNTLYHGWGSIMISEMAKEHAGAVEKWNDLFLF